MLDHQDHQEDPEAQEDLEHLDLKVSISIFQFCTWCVSDRPGRLDLSDSHVIFSR